MSKSVCTLVMFLLVATVCFAAAPGPERSVTDPSDAATISARTLFESAILFRELAAIDFARAAGRSAEPGCFAFVLDTASWRKVPEIWTTFFSGAFVIAGNASSTRPVFGFYNPFFDGVILTQWQAGVGPNQSGAIVAAAFARGSDLRGTVTPMASAAPAAWMIDSDLSPPRAIGRALPKFIADFEECFPPSGRDVATLTTTPAGAVHLAIMTHHAAVICGIIAMLHDEKHRDAGDKIWSFFVYLAKGDRAKLAARLPANNPLSLDKILEIPELVRSNFVPIYVAVTDTRCLMFMCAPNFPQYIGVLEVTVEHEEWGVRSFGFFDVANLKD